MKFKLVFHKIFQRLVFTSHDCAWAQGVARPTRKILIPAMSIGFKTERRGEICTHFSHTVQPYHIITPFEMGYKRQCICIHVALKARVRSGYWVRKL